MYICTHASYDSLMWRCCQKQAHPLRVWEFIASVMDDIYASPMPNILCLLLPNIISLRACMHGHKINTLSKLFLNNKLSSIRLLRIPCVFYVGKKTEIRHFL